MKIPIRIKPGGPKPSAKLLVRRVGNILPTSNQRRLDPSHPNTHIEWPPQTDRGEPRIFPQAAPRTITRMFVAALLVLALNDAARAATFPYSNNPVYVEHDGAATLTETKRALPNARLQLVDPANNIWLLSANLHVADGCTLSLQGDAVGGDVNELRRLGTDTVIGL